jgi:hypothetical protein
MRRFKTMMAVLAVCGLGAMPTASATADPPTGIGPVDTIIGSLSGGITSHKFKCDENHPKVKALIQGVRDSLKYSYPDISTMLARGYVPYFDAPLFGLSGRQGHWMNAAYMDDGHIADPQRPEAILTDKWFRPIGVMFIEDEPEKPGPNLYTAEDGTPCNIWHYHAEITADSYWWLYKYLWSDDVSQGDIEPEDRSPDLAHVWRYGDYQYQWNHAAPPADQLPGDPGPQELPCIVTAIRPPGYPLDCTQKGKKVLTDLP